MNPNFDAADIDWAAVQNEWQLEPELRPAPPRRIFSRAPRSGFLARIGGASLGCALFGIFALGLMLSLWAGLAVLILPFGSTTTGKITAHEITSANSPGLDKSGTYMLTFEFAPAPNGALYTGEWPVGYDTFMRLRNGDAAKVRYFPLFPGLRPALEAGVSPWFHVWFLGPLGLLLLAISGLPMLGMLPFARAEKRLVARGLAAPALIVARDNGRVTFWFRVSNASGETQTIEVTQSLTSRDWESARIGEVATALFDARRPNRAALYVLCEWRALNRRN